MYALQIKYGGGNREKVCKAIRSGYQYQRDGLILRTQLTLWPYLENLEKVCYIILENLIRFFQRNSNFGLTDGDCIAV